MYLRYKVYVYVGVQGLWNVIFCIQKYPLKSLPPEILRDAMPGEQVKEGLELTGRMLDPAHVYLLSLQLFSEYYA